MTDKPAAKKKEDAAASNATPTETKADAATRKDDDALKAILKAALKDAAFDGFTDGVLAKAGKSAGVDKADAGAPVSGRRLSLIEYFSASVDGDGGKGWRRWIWPRRKIRERIKIAVLTRLALLEPNKEAARRAAALMTLPMHAARAPR